MSAGAASLLFLAVTAIACVIDLLVPFDAPARVDEIERGSTTILPEDR